MDPLPDPTPPDPNPRENFTPDINPVIPFRRIVLRPLFPEPDPVRAVPRDYFPDKEQLSTYAGQLREGLQTLVQGPLDYRLMDFLNSWNDSSIGVHQSEFDTAARLTIATLDAGPHTSNKNQTPLGAKDWGTLASACLAAIA